MFEEIIQIVGKNDGPTSIILAGVHGDEKCGIEAFQNVLLNLEVESGTVFFAYGNPRAIQKNVRFTEANLNRMFSDNVSDDAKASYEYQRAQFLKTYLDKAEVLLDIHASSIPDSRAFVICEPNAKDIVRYLPVDLVVSGFDDVEPGGTDYYMNKTGKVGVCLECSDGNDSTAAELAEAGVLAFLKARGHITGDIEAQKQSYVHMFKKYYAKTDNFTLSRPLGNFEKISKDYLIGMDGQAEVKADQESLILFASNGTKIGEEVFLLGEEKNSLV